MAHTSQNSFEVELNLRHDELNWKSVYRLPRSVTIDESTRIFQYKLLNNILYLNHHLCKMQIREINLCSFCQSAEETYVHFFVDCTKTKQLWKEVKSWLGNAINLPDLNSQNALLFFRESHLERYSILANHLLLIIKKSLYDGRERDILPSFYYIRAKIAQTEKTELLLAKENEKCDFHFMK